MPDDTQLPAVSREQLIFSLYEAAELEHCLMCTYLYAAFSLKDGEAEGLSAVEAEAVSRWRRTIIDVAVQEMGHLAAVWNLTSALGGAPRIGRQNFPLDIGFLPAGIVVRLKPFSQETLQHFIHLERPIGSDEPEGDGFEVERNFSRSGAGFRLTPSTRDYDAVGEFYVRLQGDLRAFVADVGEDAAFCGDPGLQLKPAEVQLDGAKVVICLKTALHALDAIVLQGEGAPGHSETSHFQMFATIREEYRRLLAANPDFAPSHPAAQNPVLRPPPRREGRVWIEDAEAIATVDLANACYALMLRLMAASYTVTTGPEKTLLVDLGVGLMQAMTLFGERAARLPAGASNPQCNAGMSFTTLRDSSPLPAGPAAWRFFNERFGMLSVAAAELGAGGDRRIATGAKLLDKLAARAAAGEHRVSVPEAKAAPEAPKPPSPPHAVAADGVEEIEGEALTLIYNGKRCIHSRFCVTQAPKVFKANTPGEWIYPDAMPVEALVEVAHACPSGAIRYRRKDGKQDEQNPPVNLISIREAGPYAFRGELMLDGVEAGKRLTLCRCGASKHKPYCDGSHKEAGFSASGEPPTGQADMLEVRDGPLTIDPQLNGPLQVRGNIEIISGTGRVVARPTAARLCRCGGSSNKPFCDNTHLKNGFRSD